MALLVSQLVFGALSVARSGMDSPPSQSSRDWIDYLFYIVPHTGGRAHKAEPPK